MNCSFHFGICLFGSSTIFLDVCTVGLPLTKINSCYSSKTNLHYVILYQTNLTHAIHNQLNSWNSGSYQLIAILRYTNLTLLLRHHLNNTRHMPQLPHIQFSWRKAWQRQTGASLCIRWMLLVSRTFRLESNRTVNCKSQHSCVKQVNSGCKYFMGKEYSLWKVTATVY